MRSALGSLPTTTLSPAASLCVSTLTPPLRSATLDPATKVGPLSGPWSAGHRPRGGSWLVAMLVLGDDEDAPVLEAALYP